MRSDAPGGYPLRRQGRSAAIHGRFIHATDMGGPSAPVTPQQAVQGMIRVIDTLTPEKNGRFFTWRGQEQVW